MIRIAMPAPVLVLSAAAHAEAPMVCDPARMDCSPLVACVEATGEIFRGASFGRDSGPLWAQSPAGVLCEGTWRRTFMGLGLAEFACSDGRRGRSAFTWFEPESGTAVGSGTFSTGEEARFRAATTWNAISGKSRPRNASAWPARRKTC